MRVPWGVTSSLLDTKLYAPRRPKGLVPRPHFAEACRRANVPVEFTLFPRGPHGMGLALDEPNEARGWTTQLLAWLARQWGA
jgi:acetyl esterase/lipase